MCYGTKKVINIDSESLRFEIKKRGLLASRMSDEMGYNRSFMSHALSSGTLSVSASIMLDKCFGIKREDYELFESPDESVPETVEKVTEEAESTEVKDIHDEQAEEMWKRLYQVVYSAVYEAVKKAWSE